jgi:carboxymethylenebutenolidase
VIIVAMEIFGLHEYIKDVCRRFAKVGACAVAPDYYYRSGDLTKITDIQQIFPIVNAKADAELVSDLDATVRWAQADGGNVSRLGITGFCRGGRTTWIYTAHNKSIKAAVAWYGPVVGNPNPAMPKNAIDLVSEINAPVLGLYGGADTGIPNETVQRMEAAMKAAGKKMELVLYPDTPHAFHADYRPTYRKDKAEDGWNRAVAWFKANGVLS